MGKIEKTFIPPLQLLAAEKVWESHVIHGRGYLRRIYTDVLHNATTQHGINIPGIAFVGKNKHRVLNCKRKLSPDETRLLCTCLHAMELHPRQIHNRRYCMELRPLFYGFTNPRHLELAERKLLELERMDFALTDYCASGCFPFINWNGEVCVLAVIGGGVVGGGDTMSDLEEWSLVDWHERFARSFSDPLVLFPSRRRPH